MNVICPVCKAETSLPPKLVAAGVEELGCDHCGASFRVLPGGTTMLPDKQEPAPGAAGHNDPEIPDGLEEMVRKLEEYGFRSKIFEIVSIKEFDQFANLIGVEMGYTAECELRAARKEVTGEAELNRLRLQWIRKAVDHKNQVLDIERNRQIAVAIMRGEL